MAVPLFAQERRGGPPTSDVAVAVGALQEDTDQLAAALKRDAFIVSRVAAGAGALHGFQRTTALQQLNDRIDEARRRAQQNPPAPGQVMQALSEIADLAAKAKEAGSFANLDTLQAEVVKKSEVIQAQLFRELYAARRIHGILSDGEARIVRLNHELDDAMILALGAALDYTETGGGDD